MATKKDLENLETELSKEVIDESLQTLKQIYNSIFEKTQNIKDLIDNLSKFQEGAISVGYKFDKEDLEHCKKLATLVKEFEKTYNQFEGIMPKVFPAIYEITAQMAEKIENVVQERGFTSYREMKTNELSIAPLGTNLPTTEPKKSRGR